MERIRPNNICVKAFTGVKMNAICEIELVLKIEPIDYRLLSVEH